MINMARGYIKNSEKKEKVKNKNQIDLEIMTHQQSI